jgi:PAS domain S-box-containing protein
VTHAAAITFAVGALLGALLAAWWWRRPGHGGSPSGMAAAELLGRLRRAELLARHANDIILLADARDRVVDVNDRFCELLGYTREETARLTVRDLSDPATLVDPAVRTLEQFESAAGLFETRFRRKDGSTFPVEISVRLADIDGAVHRQAIVRDITERRRLELQLQLADRMDAVATLSAGVAHEVNNPLSYVLANVDFVLSRLDHLPEDLGEIRKALEDARSGAIRVGQIVRDLRTFSRAGEVERTEVDVRRALQSAVTLAQSEIRQRAQLSLELGPVPPVLGNAHRVGQVFLNLLVNAAQAIPLGDPVHHLVQATTSVNPDGRVRIEIIDTGAGIPAELLPRIFDPFFTTRAIGKGLGLGLAIVHGIVTDLGGEVSVRSEPDGGSIFTVLLPPARRAGVPMGLPLLTPSPMLMTPLPDRAARTPSAEAPPGEASSANTPSVGRLRAVTVTTGVEGTDILVIDDEPMVGRAITRMLVPPHRVVCVGSAADALEQLATGRFDTILCDLMMPEMTGMALYQQLQAEAPAHAARMVFLSGGAFTQEAIDFLQRVPNARLEKPFTPAQLRAAVGAGQTAPRG